MPEATPTTTPLPPNTSLVSTLPLLWMTLDLIRNALQRHPELPWVIPLVVGFTLWTTVAMTELLTYQLIRWYRPQVGGLMVGCILSVLAIIPQMHRLHLSKTLLFALLVGMQLFLQYCTAAWLVVVGSPGLGHSLVMLFVGIPNLMLTAHMVGMMLLHQPINLIGHVALRQFTWKVYTLFAPCIIIPQIVVYVVWNITHQRWLPMIFRTLKIPIST